MEGFLIVFKEQPIIGLHDKACWIFLIFLLQKKDLTHRLEAFLIARIFQSEEKLVFLVKFRKIFIFLSYNWLNELCFSDIDLT